MHARRSLVLAALFVVLGTLGAEVSAAAPPPAPEPRTAFTVDGVATPMREVVADLVALARNEALDIVSIEDEGDRTPVRGVVATWVTGLIHAAVVDAELAERGVSVTAKDRALALREQRRAYGAAWAEFPARFRRRALDRTAGAIALARDEGIRITEPGAARAELAAVITELAGQAEVSVAERFGTWDPVLAVVVPPSDGPAS